ncbi:HEAT repeat domain-containing protein [Nocardia sp. NPDC050630]|uniref:HEAT repeat domain-containing protein n=1 Tax=Nocardia sp. NPDC050630 TaxID=3364321 RepID=UPI00378DEEC4
MRISSLVEQLGALDPDHRRAAANALMAAGAQAVEPLMAALRDPDSWYAHHGWYADHCAEVLQQIGDPAFWPLVDAVTNVTEPRAYNGRMSLVGEALKRLRVSDRNMFVPLLHHESRNVRSWTCSVFAAMGAGALPYVPAVLPLLADEDPHVRYSACGVFRRLPDESLSRLPALLPLLSDPVDFVRREARFVIRGIGWRVMSVLREIRRSPGTCRRHALIGLVETVGWGGLDPADRALLQRLIRIKIPHEVPESFAPDGQWYAIPTCDQAAVLDALHLSDPIPVTMRLGQAAASNGFLLDGKVGYVTPVLNGWTLAFVWGYEFEDTTVALSRRFGTTHGYINWDDYHGCGFATGWCVAENGTTIRYYLHQDDFYQTGPPLPAEHGYILPHEDPDASDDVDRCYAMDIAARISVDPRAIGPRTKVEGHPVLALTEAGRCDGVPRGVLPI